jgi:hypothetical protein
MRNSPVPLLPLRVSAFAAGVAFFFLTTGAFEVPSPDFRRGVELDEVESVEEVSKEEESLAGEVDEETAFNVAFQASMRSFAFEASVLFSLLRSLATVLPTFVFLSASCVIFTSES